MAAVSDPAVMITAVGIAGKISRTGKPRPLPVSTRIMRRTVTFWSGGTVTTIMMIVVSARLAVIVITAVGIIAPAIIAGADKSDLKGRKTLGVARTGVPSRISRITILGTGRKEGASEKAGREHKNLFHHGCLTLGVEFKFDLHHLIYV